VIEGAILLHHENNVLDVFDRAGAVVGGNCQGASNAPWESRGGGTCGQKF